MVWDLSYAPSVLVGVVFVGLICLPLLYALHMPAWSAGPIAAFAQYKWWMFHPKTVLTWDEGGPESYQTIDALNVLPSAVIAGLVCEGVARLVFARAWRVHALAFVLLAIVAYFVLAGRCPPEILLLSAAFAIGLCQVYPLRMSWRIYRVLAYLLFFFVICIHPGIWGSTSLRAFAISEILPPLGVIILCGIALQLGAAVNRRMLRQEAHRRLSIFSDEFGRLFDRLWPASA